MLRSGRTYHFYYLSRATTFNSANTKLVALAPGLRPERRFAPLARGLYSILTRSRLKGMDDYIIPKTHSNPYPEPNHKLGMLKLSGC